MSFKHRKDSTVKAAKQLANDNEVPGWRKIEALRDRMALREELSNLWVDDPEFDDSIFFPDKVAAKRFYVGGKKISVNELIKDDNDSTDD